MKKRTRSLHGLGELQTEVMEIIWDRGEATVSQIHKVICTRREVTYTTALAAVQKLEKKGWLTHRREGRAHVFRAKKTREATHGSLLKEILQQAFRGDMQMLLSHLLEQKPMTDEELANLKKTIDAHRREKRRE